MRLKKSQATLKNPSNKKNKTESKHLYNGINLPSSKDEVKYNSNNIEEGLNSQDVESIEVDWEGELISALEEMNK